MSHETEQDRIWYKEPGVWMVITPLIVVVIVSLTMVSIAVITADDVVSDDYFKDGRMHNKEFSAENKARELGISAQLSFQKENGELSIELNEVVANAQLTILFTHPAQAEYDFLLNLQKTGEKTFRAKSNKPFTGRWNLRLSAHDKQQDLWRVDGNIDFSVDEQTTLEAL